MGKKISNLYKKPLIWLVGLALLAGTAGCTREESDIPAPPDGEKVDVEFRLDVESMKSVVPRSAATKAEADGAGLQITFGEAAEAVTRSGAEETITHLWVFQYAKSGKYEGQLIGYAQVKTAGLTETGDGTYAFTARLAWSDDCEIIVVANHIEFGYDQSLSSLSAAKTKVYEYGSSIGSISNNPMVGIYSGAVPNDYVWVPMTRLKARISLNIVDGTPSQGITLQSVQLKSVAMISPYYDRAEFQNETGWIYPEAATSPAVNAGLFMDYTENTSGLDQTISWYLSENRQGNASTVITSQKDKWIGASPTYNVDGEGKSYATHIVIKGIYNDGTDQKNFTITFFPGDQDNLNNNFDIVRNNHYIINATITNFDEDDPRIEIEEPAPSYNYVVKYYKESLQGELLGDSSGEAEEGTLVGDLLDDGKISLHYLAPRGYTYAGVVDPSSATVISSDEASNVIYVVYKYSYIVLRYILIMNETETELQSDENYTLLPGEYGPYTPPEIDGAEYTRREGGLPSGNIGPGETITITFYYAVGSS